MKRENFYKSLRRRDNGLFGTSLSQSQVYGVEAILDECIAQGCDLGQTAYILATAYGETGGKMQPVRENMNYSAKRITQVFSAKRRQGIPPAQLANNPKLLANTVYGGEWGEKNLGNRPGTNDGWDFRGFWIGQITGRRNAQKWADRLGVDIINNPETIDRLDLAVRGLVKPMMEGWATGRSLPGYVKGGKRDYVGARAVWNGSFAAREIAGHAEAFEAALYAAGWSDAPDGYPPVRPDVEPTQTAPAKPHWLSSLINALLGMFKKSQ